MPERNGITVAKVEDIRNLPAKFRADRGSHFAAIRGDAGFISAGGNAKVAIFGRWRIEHSGQKPDGTPRHRFKGQFKWKNDTLLAMCQRGSLKPRVILQFRTRKGQENVDILGWGEWRLEDGILYLEDIYQTEGVRFRPIDDTH